MHMMTARVWLTATTGVLVALLGGAVVAAVAGQDQLSDQASAAAMAAQGGEGEGDEGGGEAGGDCGDRNCDAWDGTEDDSSSPDGGEPGGGGGGGPCTWTQEPILVADDNGGQIGIALVAQTTIEIPCYMDGIGWYDGGNCYLGDPPPLVEPPAEPPPGQTEEDGQYYYERCFFNVRVFNGSYVFTWQADLAWRWVENADVPTVTPLQVAQDWLASVTLDRVEFRLSPPTSGAGLVNLPVWLAVNETENSWGETDASHCLQGVCVTISALVDEVRWSMGDGSTFTCSRDQHVAWTQDKDFLSPGNNCHHYYDQASRNQPGGKYQITASSHWAVHWEADASGASGELETTLDSETSIQIDEIQVLTR